MTYKNIDYIIDSMPSEFKKDTIHNHTYLTFINQYTPISYASLNNQSTTTVPIYEINYILSAGCLEVRPYFPIYYKW